jgi:hypothetical protein
MPPKHPHPSGRPIRHEERKPRQYWNYPPDPGVVYATPRLRPKPPLPVADAIGYLRVEPHADEDHAVRIGFVVFP